MKVLFSVFFILTLIISKTFSAPGDLLWRYQTGNDISSSPHVSDGVVYVSSEDHYLYAIYCSSGTLKWKYLADESFYLSSPCVSNGIVYVGNCDNNLYAINSSDGSLKWKYQTGDNIYASPCISDGVVYFGSYDWYIYAINSPDATLKWKYPTNGCIESSPFVSDGIVYIGGNDFNLYALNTSDGSLKWKYRAGKPIHSSPCVSDGVVYVGCEDTYLYAINSSDGALIWKYKTEECIITSSPFISDGVVYVGSYDNYLYAINCSDGTLKWRYKTDHYIDSSPCFSEGFVYIGSWDTFLYTIMISKGTLKWRYKTDDMICSSPYFSDEVIYIGSYDSYLYAIDAKEILIQVLSPNGGEEWDIGSIHYITWISRNVDTVSVKFTSDGGSLWTEIVKMPAETRKYSWTIPDTPSENCLVRIDDIKGNATDTSDSTFTIKRVGFKENKSASYIPAKSFSASPNPFTDRLTISLPSSGAIYSLTGQLIMNLSKGKHSLDTSKWRDGVYIIKCNDKSKRIIKI